MTDIKIKKQEKNTVFYDYLPAFITLLLTFFTLILYSTVMPEQEVSTYLAILVIAVTPFVIVFANLKGKLGIPQYLIVLMCTHAVMSVDMGTSLGFYEKITWWDALVHAYFGFLACDTLYYLYFRFKKDKPALLDFIGIVLLVISFAALWEVYEFFAGIIFDCDMQDVELAISQGIPPLSDTISDIVLATMGALLNCAVIFIKKRLLLSKENKAAEIDRAEKDCSEDHVSDD